MEMNFKTFGCYKVILSPDYGIHNKVNKNKFLIDIDHSRGLHILLYVFVNF